MLNHVSDQRALICLSLLSELSARSDLTAAELAQSVERLTAEREVAGSIPGVGPILRVLKLLRNEGTPFAWHVLDLRVARMTT